MRVLFWSELFWPHQGGIEILAVPFVRAMRARGHEVVVATSHAELALPDEEEHAGIRIARFPIRRALIERDIGQIRSVRGRVAALAREFQPDLIHLFALGPSAVLLPVLSGRQNPPWLVTLHGEVLREPVSGRDTVLCKLLSGADWVAGVSGAVLEAAQRLVPELATRSSVVYNGLEMPALGPAPLALADPRILCLGRLVPDKGFDVALRAFEGLLGRFPRARLLLAGDGPAREQLGRDAANLGIAGAVDFLGWVPRDRVPALLNRAAMVVMPSRREGMPLVAIQAAQMARPIVASRVGGLPEAIVHGRTGLLVGSGDAEGFRDAMCAILDSPQEATQMGQAARTRAREVFGWARHVDAYDLLYHRVAARDRHRSPGAPA
jgi:glycogen(starch) synthase